MGCRQSLLSGNESGVAEFRFVVDSSPKSDVDSLALSDRTPSCSIDGIAAYVCRRALGSDNVSGCQSNISHYKKLPTDFILRDHRPNQVSIETGQVQISPNPAIAPHRRRSKLFFFDGFEFGTLLLSAVGLRRQKRRKFGTIAYFVERWHFIASTENRVN